MKNMSKKEYIVPQMEAVSVNPYQQLLAGSIKVDGGDTGITDGGGGDGPSLAPFIDTDPNSILLGF